LGFPLTQLLTDDERRVREAADPRRQTLEEDLSIKDPRVRVDTLIRRLDEVVALQNGQPGGVALQESGIVKALIAQGDAAVGPLLNVIENDTRLTRSVSFGRDFHFDRHLIGVHEAAYVALSQILKTNNFAFGSEWEKMRQGRLDERRAVAAHIRQYLKEYGGLSLEERWYRILSNDHAGADQWLEAIEFIDVYAWKLRGYEGAPRIELYWPEAQRDAAVATCVTFLRTHQGKFVYSPERAYRYTQ
jgi:hypothetical protein